MHLAIRTGSWVSFGRELARGAGFAAGVGEGKTVHARAAAAGGGTTAARGTGIELAGVFGGADRDDGGGAGVGVAVSVGGAGGGGAQASGGVEGAAVGVGAGGGVLILEAEAYKVGVALVTWVGVAAGVDIQVIGVPARFPTSLRMFIVII